MNEFFQQKLAAERAREANRDKARAQLNEIKREFPELTQEEAGELALTVLRQDWSIEDGPHYLGGRGNFIVWFIDEAGYRRLRGFS